MAGVARWESSVPAPRPGKCLAQPMTPRAARPAKKAWAYWMTVAGSAAAARVPITEADAGRARSRTGARVVLKPKASASRAMSSPCFCTRAGLPVRATACAEGWRATASRRRSTRPPSMSTQRRLAGSQYAVDSESNARVCDALLMLRRKRMMPLGRMSLSQARSRLVSSRPARPTTSELPAAWRRVVVMVCLAPA